MNESLSEPQQMSDPLQRLAQSLSELRGESEQRRIKQLNIVARLRELAAIVDRGHIPPAIDDLVELVDDYQSSVRESVVSESLEESASVLSRIAAVANRSDTPATEIVLTRTHSLADRLTNAGTTDREQLAIAITAFDSAPQSFLRLACSGSELSDAEWDAAIECVAREFGSDVATAVMRGRFNCSENVADRSEVESGVAPRFTDSQHGDSGVPSAIPATSRVDADDRQPVEDEPVDEFDSSHALLADDDDNQLAKTQSSIFSQSGIDSGVLASPRVPHTSDIDSDVGSAAARSSVGVVIDAPEECRASTWHFLNRGDNGLAYQFATIAKDVDETVVALWAVSRRIIHAHGPLSVAATSLIDSVKVNSLSDEELLLLRAALLRIAVVAPATLAGSMLRKLPRTHRRTRIDNICLRAATTGEKLEGVFSHSFRTLDEQELQVALKHWIARVNEQISYAPGEPLYLRTHWSLKRPDASVSPEAVSRWRDQRTLENFLTRVAVPLSKGGAGAWRQVREETDRIEQLLERRQLDERDCAMLSEGHSIARGFQSLSFAGTSTPRFSPAALTDLRSELRSRRDAIVEELQSLSASSDSLAASSATNLFLQSLDDLQEILDPTSVVLFVEPTLEEVLHGELLKVSKLETDSTGRFSGEAEVLRTHLERHAFEPPVSWEAAYVFHARSSASEKCLQIARLAQLSEDQQRVLKRLACHRSSLIDEATIDELSATGKEIEEAARDGLIDPKVATEFHDRVTDIESDRLSEAELNQFLDSARKSRAEVQSIRSLGIHSTLGPDDVYEEPAEASSESSRQGVRPASAEAPTALRPGDEQLEPGSVFDD